MSDHVKPNSLSAAVADGRTHSVHAAAWPPRLLHAVYAVCQLKEIGTCPSNRSMQTCGGGGDGGDGGIGGLVGGLGGDGELGSNGGGCGGGSGGSGDGDGGGGAEGGAQTPSQSTMYSTTTRLPEMTSTASVTVVTRM